MIEGVVLSPLGQFADSRGKVMHMLRADAPHFRGFGEVYFSAVNPGVVKGWYRHRRMTLNYAVPLGRIRVLLFDDRAESPTRGRRMEIFLGPEEYRLATIPPGLWVGFQCVSPEPALLANCASIPHDPEEMERRDAADPSLPGDWGAGG